MTKAEAKEVLGDLYDVLEVLTDEEYIKHAEDKLKSLAAIKIGGINEKFLCK